MISVKEIIWKIRAWFYQSPVTVKIYVLTVTEEVEIISIRHIHTFCLDDYEVDAKINGTKFTLSCAGDLSDYSDSPYMRGGMMWDHQGNPPISDHVRKVLDTAVYKFLQDRKDAHYNKFYVDGKLR